MTDPNTQYTLRRDYGGGVTRDLTIGGEASLDEILDAFRGLLVMMGYPAKLAERLVLLDESDSE